MIKEHMVPEVTRMNIDWESFRIEAAKDILANIAGQFATISIDVFDPEFYAKVAVKWADALIAKLKEK